MNGGVTNLITKDIIKGIRKPSISSKCSKNLIFRLQIPDFPIHVVQVYAHNMNIWLQLSIGRRLIEHPLGLSTTKIHKPHPEGASKGRRSDSLPHQNQNNFIQNSLKLYYFIHIISKLSQVSEVPLIFFS